ncbi:MAG TPA: penicillin acylase family protein [Rubricoccaceae bacterium]|jgi:penicillin amidase
MKTLLAVPVLVVAVAGGAWGFLRASLPQLDGEREVPGLAAAVTVERDSLGVVQITAENRADAARALGFVHAQERFFQMDLLRRAGAGELSALLGARTLDADRALRPHRFRVRARAALALLPPADRSVLDAYVAGVNTGLAALEARPFEYVALRMAPVPWRPEDTILVGYAMFLDLQRGGLDEELETLAERAALPPALARFLDSPGDAYDAALMGDAFTPPGIPPPDSLAGYRPGRIGGSFEEEDANAGSNNWVVAGARTATGAAMVANDMHLGIRLPHIWFRAQIDTPDGRGGTRSVGGVTLPGTPTVIAGSNGHVAWGLTNSYGDFADLVQIVPAGDGFAQTAMGTAPIRVIRDTIRVAHGESVAVRIKESPWGPVLYSDADGREYALQWAAYRPEAVDLGLLSMETATTLDAALDVANQAGIPAQNLVAGDRAGRIGWTIGGRLPNRTGRDGQMPVLSTSPDALWDGFRDPAATPRVVDPEDGQLWTANNRVASGEALALVGLGPYDNGARAGIIRDDLRRLTAPITETDLLAVQLDDRGTYYARWQHLLLQTLDGEALRGRPDRAALRARVAAWGGRASIESVGYGPVRAFHETLDDGLTAALLAPARARFGEADDLREAALWQLVTERPAHLLPADAASWRAVLIAAADSAMEEPATWGEHNRAAIAHPLAAAIPLFGDRLRMPPDPLAGDDRMPRVQRPDFGASERMVVSPGHEAQGILHMPGGQAGHPLSPYWGAGHDAWVTGRALPFLPGRPRWTLRLVPA